MSACKRLTKNWTLLNTTGQKEKSSIRGGSFSPAFGSGNLGVYTMVEDVSLETSGSAAARDP